MKMLGNSPLGKAFSKKAFKEIRENIFGESISFLISGGANIKNDTLEFFNAIGYHMANGYGMSEVGITSVELSDSYSTLISSSIGKPLSNVNYSIDENGLLNITGKACAKYVISGDKTEYPCKEKYNSYDIATFDKGNYFVGGRNDDIIIGPNGENINPNLTEQKLYVDNVLDLCLVQNNEKDVVLVVSVSKYTSLGSINKLKEEIQTKLKELNLVSSISKIFITTSSLLGKNDFKLNRKKIEKEYNENRLVAPKDKSKDKETLSQVGEKILEFFAIALSRDKDEIGINESFFNDLGGTSLDYFELLSVIEKEFNVSIPSDDVKYDTIKDITDYIEKLLW